MPAASAFRHSVPVRFDTQVVVITGAARGLGRAYALAVAGRGGAVVVNDLGGSVAGDGRSASPAEELAASIRAGGGRAIASADDVGTADRAARVIAAARQAFGRVDAVIANAGILRDRTLLKMPPADFEEVVRVHLLGTAWVVQAALPLMKDQGYGRVVRASLPALCHYNGLDCFHDANWFRVLSAELETAEQATRAVYSGLCARRPVALHMRRVGMRVVSAARARHVTAFTRRKASAGRWFTWAAKRGAWPDMALGANASTNAVRDLFFKNMKCIPQAVTPAGRRR